MVDKMTMGGRIREARKNMWLTQEQLAERTDVTVVYISEIERGLKMPSMTLFIKLIEELDVSADYLLSDFVSTGNRYGDSTLTRKMEKLTPKQRVALNALIDTFIAYAE